MCGYVNSLLQHPTKTLSHPAKHREIRIHSSSLDLQIEGHHVIALMASLISLLLLLLLLTLITSSSLLVSLVCRSNTTNLKHEEKKMKNPSHWAKNSSSHFFFGRAIVSIFQLMSTSLNSIIATCNISFDIQDDISICCL